MPTIPSGQQFHTLSSTVDTVERGSAQTNSDRSVFTMQDIADTIVHPADAIDGSGTANKIPLWSETNRISDSLITQIEGGISVDGTINIKDLNERPASSGSDGQPGMIRFGTAGEEGYIYLCIAENTWVRSTLAPW
tara:strand:+ start:1263 stop:1670 length:408 start_codon:yes stop_codon:yes gene_type:complete